MAVPRRFDGASPLLVRSAVAALPLTLGRWDGAAATRQTTARLHCDGAWLHAEFDCEHDGLVVDHDLPLDRPAARLWELDVVELFISDRVGGLPYHEIEASPLGQWLTLAFDHPRVPSKRLRPIVPTVEAAITSNRFQVRMSLRIADLRTQAVATGAAAASDWRVGLFRIAGRPPARNYDALLASAATAPDFHTPTTWAHARIEL